MAISYFLHVIEMTQHICYLNPLYLLKVSKYLNIYVITSPISSKYNKSIHYNKHLASEFISKSSVTFSRYFYGRLFLSVFYPDTLRWPKILKQCNIHATKRLQVTHFETRSHSASKETVKEEAGLWHVSF